MTWLDSPMLALDAETTGTDPEAARIVQIAMGVSAHPGDWKPFTWLVNPGVPIPAEATAVHGITDERVSAEGCPPQQALWSTLIELLSAARDGLPVVSHNAAYDLTVLDREFRRHLGERLPSGLIVIDTLILHWRFDWTTGGRSLSKLAARHGIEFPAHDAEADARATLDLLRILADANDLLPLIEPHALHQAQVGWWAARQESLEARVLGNGAAFVPQPHWPLVPAAPSEDGQR